MKWKQVLREMKPYKPGRSIEEVMETYNLTEVVKLASNENPYGCAKSVKEFLNSSTLRFEIYPDGNGGTLRKKLSEKYGVDEGAILFGNGSDETISIISRALLDKGSHAIMATPTFPQYAHNAKIEGAAISEIPLVDGQHDLPAFLEEITDQTAVIFVCNPNNPTGNLIPKKNLISFIEKVPEHILIVLDEAYIEFVTEPDYVDSISLLKRFPNILIMRTFSKAYGLASFRIGYAIGSPSVIEPLNKVRNPFNNNSLAITVAEKALEDEAFIDSCRLLNAEQRERFKQYAAQNSLNLFDSQTNFVLIEVPIDADEASEFLLEKGFIVRSGNALGTPHHVRITIGTEEQNNRLFSAFDQLLMEKGRK